MIYSRDVEAAVCNILPKAREQPIYRNTIQYNF